MPVFEYDRLPVAPPGAVQRLAESGVGVGKPDRVTEMGLAQAVDFH
jgi:hypothetical protein